MKFILVWLTGILLCSTSAFPSDEQTQGIDPKAIKEVAKFLKHYVHELDREVGVFISPEVLTPLSENNRNFKAEVVDFFSKSVGYALIGDVDITAMYQDAIFLPIKKGSKYIDLTFESKFPAAFRNKLSKLVCNAESITDMDNNCKDLLDGVRKLLNVQVTVTTQTQTQFICPSNIMPQVGIFSDKVIDFDKVVELTPKDPLYMGLYQSEIGNPIETPSISWAKQNIFGCDVGKGLGNVNFDEGQMGSKFRVKPEPTPEGGESKGALRKEKTQDLKRAEGDLKKAEGRFTNLPLTDTQKMQIKKTVDFFRPFVTTTKENLYVFRNASDALTDAELIDWKYHLKMNFQIRLKDLQSATSRDILESYWSTSPDLSDNFLMVEIPKGKRILDLRASNSGALRNVMSGTDCNYNDLTSNDGTCRFILNEILKELKISVIRPIQRKANRISRQCVLATGSYTLLDLSLIEKSNLIKPDNPKIQRLAEDFKRLDSLKYSGDETSDLSHEQKMTLDWALKKHLAVCSDVKGVHILKEMPNLAKAVIATSFVLSKDTYGFHWQRLGAILWDGKMPTDSTDYQIKEYIRSSTIRFWSDRSGGGSGGTGLYFATDPDASSRSYGDTLLKVSLKKGTRYFNYYGGFLSELFPREALEELRAQNCSAENLREIYYGHDIGCENIAMALTKDLKIGFIIFSFRGQLPPTCHKPNLGQAFVVFDPSAIVPEKTIVIPENGTQIGIPASFKKEGAMLTRFRFGYNIKYKALDGLSVSDDEFNKWIHDGFYGCDDDPLSIREISQ